MKKTTPEKCNKCKYHVTGLSGGPRDPACYYYIITKQRRGCPIGWCDKYEKGRPDNKGWQADATLF